MQKEFYLTPLSRFLLFYVSGIVFFEAYGRSIPLEWMGVLFIFGFAFCLFSFFIQGGKFFFKEPLFALSVFLFAFTAGYLFSHIEYEKSSWRDDLCEKTYLLKITERGEDKAKTVKYAARIENRNDRYGKKVIVYIRRPAPSIAPGEMIRADMSLQAPRVYEIGDHFEYSDYLRKQGVAAVGFLSAEKCSLIGKSCDFWDFKSRALNWRDFLMEKLWKIFPEKSEHALSEALLLGYQMHIDRSVKEAFSSIGTVHILSVSGMHVGVIYLIVEFLLSFFGNFLPKYFRAAVVLFFMWGFALLTGLSSPVVRSAFMISFTVVSAYFGKGRQTQNSVISSAFLMLLCNPFYLFDLSFQLSYAAVFSILFIHPLFSGRYKGESRIMQYLWNLSSVSIAAQIGTLPLSVYYFGNIPLLFLISNLLIVPQTSVLMVVLVFSLLASVWGQAVFVLKAVAGFFMKLYLSTTDCLNAIPYGSIRGIRIEACDVVCIYLILAFLYLFVRLKDKKFAYLGIVFVAYQLIYYL